MLKKILIGIVVILPLVAFAAKPIVTHDLEIKPSEMTVYGQIDYYSKLYNTNYDTVSKVIQCESKFNPNAVGDGGRSRGIGQFQEPTFNRLSRLMSEELDYNSQHDQIKLLTWSIANGHGREWTAYRCIMNGGSYSFYSSQLKKHFTVSCK